jgi:hypothetical protein
MAKVNIVETVKAQINKEAQGNLDLITISDDIKALISTIDSHESNQIKLSKSIINSFLELKKEYKAKYLTKYGVEVDNKVIFRNIYKALLQCANSRYSKNIITYSYYILRENNIKINFDVVSVESLKIIKKLISKKLEFKASLNKLYNSPNYNVDIKALADSLLPKKEVESNINFEDIINSIDNLTPIELETLLQKINTLKGV